MLKHENPAIEQIDPQKPSVFEKPRKEKFALKHLLILSRLVLGAISISNSLLEMNIVFFIKCCLKKGYTNYLLS